MDFRESSVVSFAYVVFMNVISNYSFKTGQAVKYEKTCILILPLLFFVMYFIKFFTCLRYDTVLNFKAELF